MILLRESTLNHANGWEVSKQLQKRYVYVKFYPCTNVRCMKDYAKPPARQDSVNFVLHVRKNNLESG